jgi:putative tryptophan/tyrosine transport system substrate-binding protein
MRRRDFIKVIVGSAATSPLAALAQQTAKAHRIAVVSPSTSIADIGEGGSNPAYVALFKELRRLGYIEGVNLVVTRYSGEGREERFPDLCQEVVRTKPDVVVTVASRLVLAFKAATDAVPVVASMADPVPFGIVTNIARPGGNITGVTVEAGTDIWGKRVQVLREAVPIALKVGFLGSRQIWSLPQVDASRQAAEQLGISLVGPPLESPIQAEEYRRVLGQWCRNMWTGLSSVIKQKTPTTRSLLLIWCVLPSCQRFSPTVSILNLGRSLRTALRFQMVTADLRVTSTRF